MWMQRQTSTEPWKVDPIHALPIHFSNTYTRSQCVVSHLYPRSRALRMTTKGTTPKKYYRYRCIHTLKLNLLTTFAVVLLTPEERLLRSTCFRRNCISSLDGNWRQKNPGTIESQRETQSRARYQAIRNRGHETLQSSHPAFFAFASPYHTLRIKQACVFHFLTHRAFPIPYYAQLRQLISLWRPSHRLRPQVPKQKPQREQQPTDGKRMKTNTRSRT